MRGSALQPHDDNAVLAAMLALVHALVGNLDESLPVAGMFRIGRNADGRGDIHGVSPFRTERLEGQTAADTFGGKIARCAAGAQQQYNIFVAAVAENRVDLA